MFRRILRSTITLAVTIAAYQAYVLLAVPRMEPALAIRTPIRVSEADPQRAGESISAYQRMLGNYFPATHWSLTQKPKVFANGTQTVMLVIDDYTRHPVPGDKEDLTQIDIQRFAMLLFPTPPHADVAEKHDAIVLEAEHGAKLLFDDFHPEQGRLGQIVRGEFPGRIAIRSDMRAPGPEDDLLIETSDLQMNTKLLYTSAPVRFRMGDTVGGGRELEIRFLADEHAQPKDTGLKIAGFDSLEIRREFQMRMQLNAASLLPGGQSKAKPASPAQVTEANKQLPTATSKQAAIPAPTQPPVDITCTGPFTFDFVRYVASVDRDVVVRQLNPVGPADQLNCNQLDIHFAAKPLPPNVKPEPVVTDPGKRQQRDMGRLEPAAIVALGHPAVAISTSKKIEARGERIQIWLREQRLRIEGGDDTKLISGPNVLQSPAIDYQKPLDQGTQIGQFRATGPGSLHFVADEKKPDQVFHAIWQTSVQLGRDKGQPVIVMEGQPELAFAAAGSLTADQVRLYLRELDATAPSGFKIGAAGTQGDDQKKDSKLAPDRLYAIGHVKITSPQMTAQTQQLVANFQMQPVAPLAAAAPDAIAGSAQPAPSGKSQSAAGKSNPAAKTAGTPQQMYNVVADQMQLEIAMRGQNAVPTTLTCDGNIVVRDVSQAATVNQQPTEIRGGQLFVDKLDTKTPHISLRGASVGSGASIPNNPRGPSRAQLTGKGVTLFVDTVEMDAHDNRLWSDGPGEATMLARGLQGGLPGSPQSNSNAQPTPVNIHWQNGLRFDGQTITFDQNVVVSSGDSVLRCDRMLARLLAPIQFGEKIEQPATSVSQIDCEGKVTIDNLTRDLGGVVAHDRAELGNLAINQQTGVFRGQGPGIIRSTRFGSALDAVGGFPTVKSPAMPSADTSKLHFLRVDFHTGLDGNMYTRELTFHDRVRSVYGPVDAWEQELDLTRRETLPLESMTLFCDELRLNEDPAVLQQAQATPNTGASKSASLNAIQMVAKSNVKIDGQTAAQGQFSVQADLASYDRRKELFILQGTIRTPAKLWRRTATGDAPPYEAQQITYNRKTGEVKGKGIQYMEITPADLQKANQQPTVPNQIR